MTGDSTTAGGSHRMLSLAFQTNKPLAEYGRLARAAENYGFDAVSVYNDMLYQPAWIPLMEMARATSRILVGPSAVNPFTCHPINLAGNIALVDEASQGRAYLGIVRGAWLDYVNIQPTHAVTAMREAIECVHRLLAGDQEAYQGKIFHLAGGDTLRWSPERRRVPVLLGSFGPKTIQACIRDVWAVKAGGTASPAAVGFIRDQVRSSALAAGRDPDAILVASGAVTVVDRDGHKARELARREVALYLPVIAQVDRTLEADPEEIARIQEASDRFDFEAAARYISDDLLHKFAFAGTPEEVAEQAERMFQAGANWVEFGTPHGLNEEEGLKLLGQVVLPALQK